MTLQEHWQRTWAELELIAPGEVFVQLLAHYSEGHRSYHSTQHLEECFANFALVRHLAERPGEIGIALWFHDAIYQPRNSDNELKSAEWARNCATLRGLTSEAGERIHSLIMMTRHNALPVGMDAECLVDVDLAILGSQPERFSEYEHQVRDEYSWVPEPLYRQERGKILKAFVTRDHIYCTEPFRRSHERQARDNITRSLAALSTQSGVLANQGEQL